MLFEQNFKTSQTCFWKLSVLHVALQQQVDLRQHVRQRRRQNDPAPEAGDARHEQLGPGRRGFLRRPFFVVVVVVLDAAASDEQRKGPEEDRADAENEHRDEL